MPEVLQVDNGLLRTKDNKCVTGPDNDCCCDVPCACDLCEDGDAPDSFFVTLAGITNVCCSPPNDNCPGINGTYELTKTSDCNYSYTLATDNHLCFFKTINLILLCISGDMVHQVRVTVLRGDGSGHLFSSPNFGPRHLDCTNWTDFDLPLDTTIGAHCCNFFSATCRIASP